jgi:hypothetical protein
MAAPAIGVRPRWAPPVRAQIDWSHPLAAGLVTAWWPGVSRDPVDGAAWTELATAHTSGAFGDSRRSSNGASQKVTRPTNPMTQTGSLMVVQRLAAAPSGNGNNYGHNANDTVNRWGAHVPFGDGTIYFDVTNSTTGRLTYAGWSWGKWDVFVFTNGATGGQSIWGNGLRLANDASIAPANGQSGAWGWGHHSNVLTAFAADCSAMIGWKRELTAGEIGQLAADPFQMLRR